MNLEQIQNQLQEIQSIDFSKLSPEEMNKILDQLMGFVDEEAIIDQININEDNDNESDNS